jgi:hypothetical protein
VLAFTGPVVLALAVVGLAGLAARGERPWRAAATALLCGLAAVLVVGLRDELDEVPPQTPPEAFELRAWADSLPPRASVLLDIPPSGVQLWAAYMLHERPVSAPIPVLGTTYPAVSPGTKADYVLGVSRAGRSRVAVGGPIFENAFFRLWRADPSLPGPDRSSRLRIQPASARP